MANEKSDNRERPYDVLIVEDNRDDADLCLRVLQKAQLELGVEIRVQAINDGTQAMAQLRKQKYDVILLDAGMPQPDGIELTTRIRHSEPNRTTPIVIITGAENRGLMTRAFQAGASWFLFKPVDRARLMHLMQISRISVERERRRLQRIKVQCKVSLEADGVRINGETLDLSLNGALVRADRVLPRGSSVQVSLLLPTNSVPIRTSARVVRVIGNDFMGLELEHIGKTESERLGEFLVPLIVASTAAGQPALQR